MCAGTDWEVHLIIFTCVRNAREEIKTGKKKRTGITEEKKMAGRKKTRRRTKGKQEKRRKEKRNSRNRCKEQGN